MKKRFGTVLDILILSINYILISYALSNLTCRLQHQWLFILFFASEVWMTALYWEQVRKKTGCKVLAAALTVLCFALHAALVYFVGILAGPLVPLR